MAVDLPAMNSTVQPGFAVAGWATDLGSTSGSGIDAVHVWGYPNPGSGAPAIFLGAANLGFSRPDVAAAFGTSSAASSGFSLGTADLPPGPYDLAVFVHSTVASAFNNVQTVRVTVASRGSRPMMVIDTPSPNATVTGTFTIGGWALDLAAQTGSGIDTVHVWAYPAGGGAPIFVGNSPIGLARPDVGAVFGAQFRPSGYNVAARLPAGNYTLAVFAHSAVANAFNNTLLVPVTVR
jgi:hypothetical protein